MKIIALSDTHGRHFGLNVPDGDVVVHCGDFCSHGNIADANSFINWFGTLPHRYKIFIAGNHDWLFEKEPWAVKMMMANAPKGMYYLEDSSVEIEGIKFHGSPVQPTFYNWAFNRDRGEAIKRHWDMIPEGTDVLLTHGPVYGIADEAYKVGKNSLEHTGCKDLLDATLRIAPKLHLFGHIHYSGGQTFIGPKTTYANVSVLDESYTVCRAPMIFDIDSDGIVSIL
jgi:predicted phosphodiesterase